MVLPDSDRVSRAPPYSGTSQMFSDFGYATITLYSETFQTLRLSYFPMSPALQPQRVNPLVWPLPPSLAATEGISYDFFSSRYLDVSVPWVCSSATMYSLRGTTEVVGFPIRKSPDQSLLSSSPKHIAACHVLHRLLMPRHPPNALSSLFLSSSISLLDRVETHIL